MDISHISPFVPRDDITDPLNHQLLIISITKDSITTLATCPVATLNV